MSRNRAGKLRRSHVVGTYGPGAIVDFRAPGSGAPLSGVIAGLEEWDAAAAGARGPMHPQAINEPRLEQLLGVKGFRLPPVRLDREAQNDFDVLRAVRFPFWLQCPRCNVLSQAEDGIWSEEDGKPERWCPRCSDEGDRAYAVPVRFIVACEAGHLDEFPWQAWIDCSCLNPQLYLTMEGPGLAGKWIRCRARDCVGKARSLEGVFSKEALKGFGCRGRRVWLPAPDEACTGKPIRTLQRGASNVYWGSTLSALDIPPFSVDLSDLFGRFWAPFERKKDQPDRWPELIDDLSLVEISGLPKEVLLRQLRDWKDALETADDEPIEWAEYKQFEDARSKAISEGEFQVAPEQVPPELSPYLSDVILAHRLREVRALVGFTRINPPSGPFRQVRQQLARLSITPLTWLPATELRGEGIVLNFERERLTEWERRPEVLERVRWLEARVRTDLRPGEVMPDCSPRFLMLHSFAHALMRQLSLECGYSSSALRERLYVGRDPYDMCGILIHTGSPDSEGTLGGLVRQGREKLLSGTVRSAVAAMAWCSSDPLCISGTTTLSSPRNGAACHACVLVPETSCQHFNSLLDRALLVGLPSTVTVGYFGELARELT